ncbi:hypothetical protein [Burkholderia cepacia]|uniref:hypothetical protein n=1 Tax=Burkholderia cepacia TaxID=292 RepID=UPI00201A17DE|nr:hypothetical protein [Burkholderia cepacia]UQO37825.1 hypothetical protein L0Z22_19340 [Burkholderia cepacia]UQO52163.1 hypothetical protein L0Z05_25475 [Burkholderia cepacia]UQP06310.1 hypothetical protein L0Z01_02305 [Burkholderia cepacia]
MNKLIVACTAFCAAGAALALYHGSNADRTALPRNIVLTHATRAGTHIGAVDEHGVPITQDDGGKRWRQVPPVALGVAKFGLGGLFTH